MRAFELDDGAGPRRDVWHGPGALHAMDTASRTSLVWNGEGYVVFRFDHSDLDFGEVSAHGDVTRPMSLVDSPRYYVWTSTVPGRCRVTMPSTYSASG